MNKSGVPVVVTKLQKLLYNAPDKETNLSELYYGDKDGNFNKIKYPITTEEAMKIREENRNKTPKIRQIEGEPYAEIFSEFGGIFLGKKGKMTRKTKNVLLSSLKNLGSQIR